MANTLSIFSNIAVLPAFVGAAPPDPDPTEMVITDPGTGLKLHLYGEFVGTPDTANTFRIYSGDGSILYAESDYSVDMTALQSGPAAAVAALFAGMNTLDLSDAVEPITIGSLKANTTIIGSDHGDTIAVLHAGVQVQGGDGNDSFTGGGTADTIDGGGGNDTITGGAGVDSLNGGDGDDVFFISNTADIGDTIDGGDTLSSDILYMLAAGGYDFTTTNITNIDELKLASDGAAWTIILTDTIMATANFRNAGRMGIDALANLSQGATIDASALSASYSITVEGALFGDDLITGGDGADDIASSLGKDTIDGGDGNDTIDGGGGDDDIDGGAGSDTAAFSGNWSDYNISHTGGTTYRIVGPDGTDFVTGVETFIFNSHGTTVAAANILNVVPDAGAVVLITGLVEDGASTKSGSLLANAIDANTAITPGGDVLKITEVQSITLAQVAVPISGDTDIVGKFGTLTVHADGTYDYLLRNNDPDTQALAPGQTVQDVFNFRVEDLQGEWDTAEINFGITGSNDAPAGTDKTITILEDGAPYTFSSSDFGFLDAEGNALQSVIITSLPAAGTLTLNGVAVSLNDTIAATAIGTLVFTPATNANGSPYGSFGFKVVDDGGTANSGHDTDATANTIRFDVTSVNDAPVITSNNGDPLAVNVNENSVSVTTIEAGDVDGTVGYALSGADTALFDISSTGVVTFIAAPDFETPKDTGLDNIYDITVVASDGSLTDTQDLTVTVNDIDGNTIAGTSSGNTIDATHKIGGKGATNEEDRIDGKAGDDTIKSGGGNDTLIGGTGKDVLTGGGGADKFVFNAKLGSTNIDTLKDFAHDIDLIQLDDKIFSKIGPSLSAGEFYAKSGAVKAHDKSDRIIYDTKTGKLYYDDDGAGGHAAVQFATLSNKPVIDHGDFGIV